MPGRAVGTLMQSAFRRNLAYIGIPLLAYSFSESAPENNGKSPIASAVIVMILTMAVYNILAVIVLQAGSHSTKRADWKKLALSIATNPLLVAGLLGLIVPVLGLALPSFVQRALESLGAAAVPIALMCIGGSLATTPLRGRLWIVTAALLKVVVLPVLVFFLARLGPAELRVALVLSSCPTAAAAFVMARQMGGDESLASGSIALSTLLSSISLAMSLSLTAWK
jgi:predicted permease